MRQLASYQSVWDGEVADLLSQALVKVSMARTRASIYDENTAEEIDALAAQLSFLVEELMPDGPGAPAVDSLPSLN